MTNEIKRNLLVTLADENYIDYAKQVFSGAYWNAGWKGEYLLLAHEVPEEKLKWFRKKGILIYNCRPLVSYRIGTTQRKPVNLSKIYLLKTYFKKWQNVIYVDLDTIIRASIDDLANVKGFTAVQQPHQLNLLSNQFCSPRNDEEKIIFDKLKSQYNLRKKTFNAGVMAFSTDIITEDLFDKIKNLFEVYYKIHINSDQPSFNLLFYKKWKKLNAVYNQYAAYLIDYCKAKPEKIQGAIIHIWGKNKPWMQTSFFYKEYKNNFDKANFIDINNPQPPQKIWTQKEIFEYSSSLYPLLIKGTIFMFIDRTLGLFGVFLKKHSPKLYSILKKLT